MWISDKWGHLLPPDDLDIDLENFQLFFKSMFERQEIWHRRFILKQEAPWSKDPIFQGKFTNVYRELDRNSQYQIKEILINKNFKNRKDLIWKLMLFRIFNNPNTFEFIGKQKKSFRGKFPSYKEYNQKEFEVLIYSLRESGENPFTNAYYINSGACPGKGRDWCYTNKVVPEIHKTVPKIDLLMRKGKDPENLIRLLNKLPSVSNFISHEFYQDFTYVPKYTDVELMKWTQDDFTNIGPGCSIGIRLIFPNLKAKEQKQAIYDLRNLSNRELRRIGDFKYIEWDKAKKRYKIVSSKEANLSLHQIEMWLCEFSKYWKMKNQVGKQRMKFKQKTKNL